MVDPFVPWLRDRRVGDACFHIAGVGYWNIRVEKALRSHRAGVFYAGGMRGVVERISASSHDVEDIEGPNLCDGNRHACNVLWVMLSLSRHFGHGTRRRGG